MAKKGLRAQVASQPRERSVTEIIQCNCQKGVLPGIKILRKIKREFPSEVLCLPSLVLISGIVQDSSVCDVTAPFVRFCCMFIYFALPTVLLSSSPLQPTRIHSTLVAKKKKK